MSGDRLQRSDGQKRAIERDKYTTAIGELTPSLPTNMHPAWDQSVWNSHPTVKSSVDKRIHVKLEVGILQIPQTDMD